MSTSRQLVDNLIRDRKAERVGLTDWFWPDTLAAWVEQGYPTSSRQFKPLIACGDKDDD